MMPDLRASITAASPVPASLVAGGRENCSVELGTGQDVVLIGIVPAAVKHLALLTDRCLFLEIVRVAVQIFHALRHHHAFSVVPRTLSDPVARIDGGLTFSSGGAQVSVPRLVP